MTDLPLPKDPSLPFFAYGLLQPREWGHRWIAEFVETTVPTRLPEAYLLERDGLPLLVIAEGNASGVRGYRLSLRSPNEAAYRQIVEFEPGNHYRWETVDTSHGRANALVGKSPRKGTVPFEGESWSGRTDPFFDQGLRAVRQIADCNGDTSTRMFRDEAAYLLLWTVLERYAALAFGPALKTNKKIDAIGRDQQFGELLKKHVLLDSSTERRTVLTRSDDPRKNARLDPNQPEQSAHYFYLIRSNITHRGKAAWRDAETIRQALNELISITEDLTRSVQTDEGVRP